MKLPPLRNTVPTTDFYSGFEGHPEIVIWHERRGSPRHAIRAWGGYLDSVMSHVEPGRDGWQGIAQHYHLLTGWEANVWEDPSLEVTMETLIEATKIVADPSSGEFGMAVVKLYAAALADGGRILWSME